MMRGWRLAGLAAMVVSSWHCGAQRTQTAQTGADNARQYRIAGVVTDAVGGQPLGGATMILLSNEPRQIVQTVVTDEEGRFRFAPMSAGKYALAAARRGYMTTSYNQHDQYSSAIVTGPGQDSEHIPFRIQPGGVVRGYVTDDEGDPVSGAKVLLVRRSLENGLGDEFVKSVDGETDDTGLFEFWNLRPGTYYLAVKADPWFALHPSQSALEKAASQEEREAMAALDVAYPMQYFDGVSDESAATPIEIKTGDRVQADISLHAVPALRVMIHVPDAGKGNSQFTGLGALRQAAFGMQDWQRILVGSLAGNPESGVMEVDGVPPGHYTVLEGGLSTDIDASGNQDVEMSTAVASIPVELKVRMSDGTPPPGKLSLTLVSDGRTQEHYRADVDAKGMARFWLVPPGRWNVIAESGTLALAVVSTQTGTTPAADSRIVVRDKRVTGTVVLAQGKTNIEGFARKDGKGEAGVMVVLVPKNPDASLAQFRRDQSDSDGSFLLRDVAPGDYTVVAIEDGWEMNWARGEVIGKYVAKGIPVRVTAVAPKMELNRAVDVEPR